MAGIVKRLEFIASLMPEDSVALSSGGQRFTYASMLDEVNRICNWFAQADSKVVALYSANNADWVLIDLACQELDLILIPVPAFFSDEQIQHCIEKAGVDTLLCDQERLPAVVENQFTSILYEQSSASTNTLFAWSSSIAQECELPEGTQKVTFTSGSTGKPKGVCLSLEHQWLVAQSLADAIDIHRPRHLCFLPLSTLLENIAGVYTPLLSGGEVIVPSDQDRGLQGSSGLDVNAFLSCIHSVKPDSLILVPQLLTVLVQACISGWRPPVNLKFIAVGGGKVSPDLIEQARQFGLPVYQGYGLSECGSVVALNTPSNDFVEKVGQVLPHCKVTIEDSEVVVSGAVHLGYMAEPSSWYPEQINTGDIGELIGGNLFIEGRIKNVLISSFGRNISPEWVESVMTMKPFFKHCVVLGDDKPFLTAIFCAPEQVSDEQVQQYVHACNQRLPDYARVMAWLRISEEEFSPFLTANGRPQREKIKTAFQERLDHLYENTDGVSMQFA